MTTPAYSLEGFAEFCGELKTDAGLPMVLEPFQREMLAAYFDGANETVCIIPKGNGKTTLLAALALYHLENTRQPRVLIVAASREQARILFDQAAGLVRNSGLEDSRFVVKAGYGKIWLPGGDSAGPRIEVKPAEAATGDGAIATLALVDELHRHKSLALYTILRKGLKKRGGQMITITTAGAALDSPLGEVRSSFHAMPGFKRDEERKYNHVRAGGAVLHEWCLDSTDDPDDLELVKRANPASFVTLEDLRGERESPSYNVWDWRRLTCCIWTEGEEPWLEPQVWDALAEKDLKIAPDEPVILGVDIGQVRQDTGLTLVAIREGVLAAEAVILHPPLDLADIEGEIRRLCGAYNVQSIPYDSSGAFERSGEVLYDDGLPMVEFPQSAQRMAQMSGTLLRVVQEKGLRHNGDPAFRAHVLAGTTKAYERGWRLVKDFRTRRSVGALIALGMAVQTATEFESEPLMASM